MTTLEEIDHMIDEFIFKYLISDTGIINNSEIIDGMNFKYSFKNSPNDIKQVELINDTIGLLEIIKICINKKTYDEEEYNADDESDIAKYTPGWTVDEDGRPVQIDNVDVDDMMEDMSL